MKSTRIKGFITILLISLSISANLKIQRTESETTFEALIKENLQAGVQVATEGSNEGGSWEKGFWCPRIELAPNSQAGALVDQGKALIEGKNFLDNKYSQNDNGLVLTFEKPFAQTAILPKISKSVKGNQIYIPWRNFYENFVFVNPTLGNKYISGKLRTDNNEIYNFKIVFPYKYFGWYIDDDQGNLIRERINTKARDIRTSIREEKDKVNLYWAEYKVAKENAAKLMGDVAGRNAQMKANQEQMNLKMKQNQDRTVTIQRLEKESQQHNIHVETIKNKIHAIKKEINNGNASIQAIASSITSLQASKKNPKLEIKKYEDEAKKTLDKVAKKYQTLVKNAEMMKGVLKKSEEGFKKFDKNMFRSNLNNIYP